MTMTAPALERADDPVLTDAQLAEFEARAAGYDERNEFFHEDFEVLRRSGFLTQNVPVELGGRGHSLAATMREQRRLAYHAPADALAVNMHLYWIGVAADLRRMGDPSLEWLLREAAEGKVFAAGHTEKGGGYDKPVVYSNTKAKRVDGGYRFTGHKQFGTLSPVWDWIGVHGLDDSDKQNPRIVHAFVRRDAAGVRVAENWNVMGMRATQSHDTVLDGVFVPDERVARIVPEGYAGADAFLLTMFAWPLLGFGNVYCGLARHAMDRAIAGVHKKQVRTMRRSMAWHAAVQHQVADMAIELQAIEAVLDQAAEDWSTGVDHGPMWPARIVGAKCRAVEGAWKIVDAAFELAGGGAVFRGAGWERMLRDARLGRIHPANGFLAREIVAKSWLGLDLDEEPRWG